MEPYRVLQEVTIMNLGGLETMIMNYYRNIDRTKIQFDFIVHRNAKGAYDNEIKQLGGNIFNLSPIRPGNYRRCFKEFDSFFDEHKEYRVVHSHLGDNSSFIARSAKQHRLPCRIAHSHVAGNKYDWRYPFRFYARCYHKGNVNQMFSCGKEAAKWLFPTKELDKVTIMNNAIETERFLYCKTISENIKKQLGIEDKFVIGHVGRFNKQKNHEYLIDIFKEVHDKEPKSILVLVGNGELEEEINRKVEDCHLKKDVIFLGVLENVNELLQGFDLFLFPSINEGLPVTVIEAQASGLQCVIANSISKEVKITDLVEFISLKQKPEYWADRILSRNNGYERRNMYEDIVKAGFDIKDNVKWLEKFYLQYYEG